MINLIKDYANKRIELLKLDATEKGVLLAGGILFLSIVIVFLSLFLILSSFGLAIWLGKSIDNLALGYFLVAIIYLVLAILCLIFKNIVKDLVASLLLKFL